MALFDDIAPFRKAGKPEAHLVPTARTAVVVVDGRIAAVSGFENIVTPEQVAAPFRLAVSSGIEATASAFLSNPTCLPEAATAAWRHKRPFVVRRG